jgi:putative NADH-flavin reductase
MKVAIIGATGKAGQYLVKELLPLDYQLRILLRGPLDPLPYWLDPRSYPLDSGHPSVEVIMGDIADPATAKLLLEGCDVVISMIGQLKDEPLISYLSTENILLTGIKRYIYIAGLTIDVPGDAKSAHNKEMSDFMRRSFPVIVADKQKAFELLSNSNIDWTLVRLPFIKQTDERGELAVSLEDCPGDHINTADLAAFLVQQITDRSYIRKAPFIASV